MFFFDALAGVVGLVSVIALVLGLRMLVRGGWLFGWLRGMTGVAVLCLALAFALVALDIRTYRALTQDKPLATISFEKTGERRYLASLIFPGKGLVQRYELQGDQWQLDARIIRWTGLLKGLGGKPGYRLDRISGRYQSVEDERNQPRTVYSLGDSEYGLDLWALARQTQGRLPWLDAQYGSATFVPMADGALYEVALSPNGLVAKPLNAAARAAVQYWH